MPENLPSLLHARKVQRRAASSGFDFPGVEGPLQSVRDELEELTEVVEGEGDAGRDARFHELGDVLFAAVNVARKLKVDPELALRGPRRRFRGRVETAAELAARDGRAWDGSEPRRATRLLRTRPLRRGVPTPGARMSQIEHVHARQIEEEDRGGEDHAVEQQAPLPG